MKSPQPLKRPLRERASCESCEFGEMHAQNDRLFYCRRHAPGLTNGAGGAVFPVVKENDWCGDFREEINAD
jgi:hypothetical protein